MLPKCLGELQAYLDKHPIRFNLVVVILLLPSISAGTFLRALVAAVVTRQGLVLSAAFVAIRIVAEWLANLYTFFWYVQTSAVSKLEGAERWSSAGRGIPGPVFPWHFGARMACRTARAPSIVEMSISEHVLCPLMSGCSPGGSWLVLGSVASLALGLLTMLVMMALAESLGWAAYVTATAATLGCMHFRSPRSFR